MKTTHSTRRFLLICALLLTALAAYSSFAHALEPLEIRLEQFQVTTDKKGKEKLVAVDRIKPGEVMEYVATYANRSKKPIAGLSAALPIPPGAEYLEGTAQPAGFQASLADGQYHRVPIKRQVKRPDGSTVEETVAASEYRGLRWDAGTLKPGQKFTARARVRIQGTTP